jgi:hypothetical protein
MQYLGQKEKNDTAAIATRRRWKGLKKSWWWFDESREYVLVHGPHIKWLGQTVKRETGKLLLGSLDR